PRAVYLFAHDSTGRAVGAGRQFLKRHARHFDVQIDAVEQRAADAADIALDLHRVALAGPARIAEVTARTRIHGRHQDKAGRESRGRKRAGNRDLAFLQWLAEHFEAAAIELRQLVEKEHAVVGEADF